MSRIPANVAPLPARQAPPPQTWPGLSTNMSAVFSEVVRGSNITEKNGYVARRVTWSHRQSLAAAGSTSIFTFFNVATADFTWNGPNNGVLNNENALLLQYLRFYIEPNVTFATGAPAVVAATFVGAVDPLTTAEQLRAIYNAGLVRFYVQDRLLAERHGLSGFAAGRGADVSITGGAAAVAGMSVNNGLPIDSNGYKFYGTGYPVLPSKTLKATVQFQALMPMAQAGVITAELEGILVQPANL